MDREWTSDHGTPRRAVCGRRTCRDGRTDVELVVPDQQEYLDEQLRVVHCWPGCHHAGDVHLVDRRRWHEVVDEAVPVVWEESPDRVPGHRRDVENDLHTDSRSAA